MFCIQAAYTVKLDTSCKMRTNQKVTINTYSWKYIILSLYLLCTDTLTRSDSCVSGLSLALVHKHVKISVDEWIMETTLPHKRVQISENQIFFASHDHFPLTFYLKLLSISNLIVADIDTQSILSVVYKYPKILWMSGLVCGRVDFRIYSSSLRVSLNP